MNQIFIFQLILAESIFVCFLPRRRLFAIRILLGVAILVSVNHLMIFSGRFLRGNVQLSEFVFIARFIISFVLSIFVIWFAFDCTFPKACWCSTGGYAVQNLVYNVFRVGAIIGGNNYMYFGGLGPFANLLITCASQAVFYIPFYFWVKANNAANKRLGVSENIWTIIIAIVVVAVCIVMSARIPSDPDFIETRVYSIICCLLVLIIQLGISERSALKKDKEIIEKLLQAEWKQHKQAQEQIDLINMKCHDLKHQINFIACMENGDERTRNIREIQNLVNSYDLKVDCGNEVLDVLLTEIKVWCEKQHIALACMVQGEALSFMERSDIINLFGNALDNAVQGVSEYERAEQRFISLNVSKTQSFLIIHVENYCDKNIKFADGLPVTTKKDKAYHGYGVKSMKYIVDKYKGNMTMTARDNLFVVDMLFNV